MPTRDGYEQGVPSWADLATPDIDGAKSFYAALFGWDYHEEQTESVPYTMADKNGLSAAGIGPLQGDMPSVWTTYISVDDADEIAGAITEAGGTILMEPADIMDSGRIAMAADPTGAVFGIWQAKEHSGAAIVNEHGALNWNELQTDDVDKAVDFYTAVFGYEAETGEGVSGPYTSLSVGERAIAGAMPKPVPEIPNYWGVYFAVDDIDDALETAKDNGGQLTYGPMDIPDVGRAAGVVDPFGAHFTVIELEAEVD